jgi:hypothetical protein
MKPQPVMDHEYIAEKDFVGRYMAGTLSPSERARFEAHFVDCHRCLDALEAVEPFQHALRAFAAEEASQPVRVVAPVPAAVPMPTPAPARPWRTAATRVLGLAAAVVIAVGIVDALRMRRQLARTTAVADVSSLQLEDAEQRVRELSAERRERLGGTVPAGALVFALVNTRGAGNASQNRVTVSGSPTWIVLLVDLDAPSPSNRYRAAIDMADGRRIWSNDQLTASPTETLAVGVSSQLLPSGDYVITADGQDPVSNDWRPAARYTFHVAR